MRLLPTFLIVAAASFGQSEPNQTGSISGTVTDAASAAPQLGLTVTVTSVTSNQFTTKTDAQGRYRLPDLQAGDYFLNITGAEISSTSSRGVLVKAGQDVRADFVLEMAARISGRVTDWDKKPVARATVVLVEELYSRGVVTYSTAMSAQTDQDGLYEIEMVKPGRRYAVMTKPFRDPIRAGSDLPAELNQRESVRVPTFLPGAESLEGAQTIELRSGQKMEGIDIQLARERQWCVSGTIELPSALGAYVFEIAESLPVIFASRNLIRRISPDGRFRVCGLTRGEYSLNVIAPGGDRAASFTVIDKDLTDLKVAWPNTVAVAVDLVWEGEDAAKADALTKGIAIRFGSRMVHSQRSRFTMPDIPIGAYPVDISGWEAGWYLKEIRYGGADVQHRIVHIGSGGDLRIFIAHDTGTLTALVADSDGQPLPSANVWVIPLTVGSAAEMEEILAGGTTDVGGVWSASLPPGKYRVLATRERFQHTASQMDRLWGVRLRGTEVEVSAKGSVNVRLDVAAIN